MNSIGIHWMTLIVSATLLVMLLVSLVKEQIQERRWKKRNKK
jgi:hypothetical protein